MRQSYQSALADGIEKRYQQLEFSALSAEFVRTQVVPELDAYRLAAYATKAGTTVAAALSTGKAATEAIMAAKSKIRDSEATIATTYLFISPVISDRVL